MLNLKIGDIIIRKGMNHIYGIILDKRKKINMLPPNHYKYLIHWIILKEGSDKNVLDYEYQTKEYQSEHHVQYLEAYYTKLL